MITGFHYGVIANTKTRVRCVLCGVYIPNANKCIDEHIFGAKHRENTKLASKNRISYFKYEELFCKLCDRIFEKDETIAQHVQIERHANWIATMQNLVEGEHIHVEAFLASLTNTAFCATCQKVMVCSLESVEEHINEDHHILQKMKPANGLFPVDDPNELWCKICDEFVENTAAAVLEHVEEDEHHVEWFAKMAAISVDNKILVGNYLTHEFENKVYCVKCRSEILCNFQSMQYHFQTEAHLNSEPPTWSNSDSFYACGLPK